MNPPRLVLCYPVEPKHVQQIQAAAGDALVSVSSQESIASDLFSADLFCGHPKMPVPWDDIVAAGRLQWIQSSAAGLDYCLVPSVINSNIIVTSASGVLADQVAEHALTLALALSRRIPLFLSQQSAREFVRRPTRDLTGSTIGIVGLGGVGRRLAEVLSPFRVRLLATDFFPIHRPPCVEELRGPDSLRWLLEQSDVVFLCVPLTSLTRGMINSQTLGCMKRGSMLINMARGPLVEEHALVDALESGHLDSAALDVTPTEPPDPLSRLWTAPRLILTPHVAGQSAQRINTMTDFFCNNLERWHQHLPLANLVDKRLGFPEPPDVSVSPTP